MHFNLVAQGHVVPLDVTWKFKYGSLRMVISLNQCRFTEKTIPDLPCNYIDCKTGITLYLIYCAKKALCISAKCFIDLFSPCILYRSCIPSVLFGPLTHQNCTECHLGTLYKLE